MYFPRFRSWGDTKYPFLVLSRKSSGTPGLDYRHISTIWSKSNLFPNLKELQIWFDTVTDVTAVISFMGGRKKKKSELGHLNRVVQIQPKRPVTLVSALLTL